MSELEDKVYIAIRHINGKNIILDASFNYQSIEDYIKLQQRYLTDSGTYSIAELSLENAITHNIIDRTLRVVK